MPIANIASQVGGKERDSSRFDIGVDQLSTEAVVYALTAFQIPEKNSEGRTIKVDGIRLTGRRRDIVDEFFVPVLDEMGIDHIATEGVQDFNINLPKIFTPGRLEITNPKANDFRFDLKLEDFPKIIRFSSPEGGYLTLHGTLSNCSELATLPLSVLQDVDKGPVTLISCNLEGQNPMGSFNNCIALRLEHNEKEDLIQVNEVEATAQELRDATKFGERWNIGRRLL